MYSTNLSLRYHPFFKDFFDIKTHLFYLKFERKTPHPSFTEGGRLETHLKSQRIKFKMSVTHLAMILSCSRAQYLRLEKGENRFKDEQLGALASIYGEDVSIYKDMQDVDNLLKKIGYNEDSERAIYLLQLALKTIKIPSLNDPQNENLSSEIRGPIFNIKPISKEVQQQKLAEIIDNLYSRFKQNDSKMGEIREKIIPMADAPNPEKAKLWQQFHLLEDEQNSILNLISKLENRLNLEESSS